MDSRKIVLLVGALVVAAITAFMARSLIVGTPAPQAVAAAMPAARPDGPQILVATKPLPVGTILDATALKFAPWPAEAVTDAYYQREGTDLAKLTGTVVRAAIVAGQPVTKGSLVAPGDRGFLAAALTPGMRAVTVPVSASNAVAGFVFPGDRVDFVLTQQVTGGGDGQPLKVSETVFRNVRVLATDQRTDNQVGEDGKTVVRTFSNITVEATPRIAEDFAVAQTLGSLSVSLRPLSDDGTPPAVGTTAKPGVADPNAPTSALTDVANAPSAGSATFSTGADVSRFQRSTVPGKPVSTDKPVVTGPIVHVARGTAVTDVTLGGKK